MRICLCFIRLLHSHHQCRKLQYLFLLCHQCLLRQCKLHLETPIVNHETFTMWFVCNNHSIMKSLVNFKDKTGFQEFGRFQNTIMKIFSFQREHISTRMPILFDEKVQILPLTSKRIDYDFYRHFWRLNN